ncbi:MAG: hypothetical protein CMH30_04755 [Micavibrio sp.]|nr:hypothetical protein [Micavibrio sp.]|tara:strand:+ start:2075 stop:2518 length:444 start_codon:yes stop_codon:yes gene_type:complete
MGSILSVLEATILKELYGSALHTDNKMKASSWLKYTMIVLLILALAAMLAGTFLWLETLYSLPIALLLTSAVMLGLSAICGLIIAIIKLYKAYKYKRIKHEIANKMHDALDLVNDNLDALKQPIEEHPTTSVIAAAVAGYMAGEKLL